jgi:hypothetical protein
LRSLILTWNVFLRYHGLVIETPAAAVPPPPVAIRPSYSIATREQWLLAAIDELRPVFALHAAPIPAALQVSIGFPSKGALRRRVPLRRSDAFERTSSLTAGCIDRNGQPIHPPSHRRSDVAPTRRRPFHRRP